MTSAAHAQGNNRIAPSWNTIRGRLRTTVEVTDISLCRSSSLFLVTKNVTNVTRLSLSAATQEGSPLQIRQTARLIRPASQARRFLAPYRTRHPHMHFLCQRLAEVDCADDTNQTGTDHA